MSAPTLPAAVRSALDRAMRADERVVVLGETVGRGGGLWGGTAGLLGAFGPERVRDLPVADRAMVGLALGLALGGQRPVLELAGTQRLVAVWEPLREAAALAAAGALTGPLVVRVPWGGEAGPRLDPPVGALLGDEIPVWCARSASEAAALLEAALDTAGPTVLLEPRALSRAVSPDLTQEPVEPVCAVRDGAHGTLVAWGPAVAEAVDVAEVLAAEGLRFEVVALRRLAPLDRAALGDRVRRTGRLCVLHGGDEALGDRIVQAVLDRAFLYLESPPARVATASALLAAAREAATW